jgi:cytochrome c oxidase assembly factor CtaG
MSYNSRPYFKLWNISSITHLFRCNVFGLFLRLLGLVMFSVGFLFWRGIKSINCYFKELTFLGRIWELKKNYYGMK